MVFVETSYNSLRHFSAATFLYLPSTAHILQKIDINVTVAKVKDRVYSAVARLFGKGWFKLKSRFSFEKRTHSATSYTSGAKTAPGAEGPKLGWGVGIGLSLLGMYYVQITSIIHTNMQI